jgi:Integrase core domain
VDYVVGKFPFRIQTIRTDNGHEFQVKFHWHVLDLGMDHVYIKPRTPRLNGKVERSHSTDQQEFYQLLSYKDDVDLEAKLLEWETFYNCHRLHASLKGKTPYEILLEKLQSNPTSTEVVSSTALVLSASLDFSLRLFPYHHRTGSQVPHQSLNQVHAAFMPETIRAVSRSPPDLSRSSEFPRF